MAVAATYSDIATKIVNNAGGSIQQLTDVNVKGGKERVDVATITMASQASGSLIMLTRVPLFSSPLGWTLIADAALATTIGLSIGNANDGSLYAASGSLLTAQSPTTVGRTSTFGVPITAGYDATTGNAVTAYAPGQGGALYDDICLRVNGAALPSSGTLKVLTKYMID